MRALLRVCVCAAALTVAGCGGSQPPLNTTPLTDEQKAAIKQEDAAVDADESPKNKTNKARPKGK